MKLDSYYKVPASQVIDKMQVNSLVYQNGDFVPQNILLHVWNHEGFLIDIDSIDTL